MAVKLEEIVPYFSKSSPEILEEFNSNHVLKEIPKGTMISFEGEHCEYFPIILLGTIRVFKIGANGQEMTLYRIKQGESCILTISCLLSSSEFPAFAAVEEDCKIILVHSNKIREWIKKYDIWAKYIYGYVSKVLKNVLTIIEDISFKRTDVRIYEYLIKQYREHGNRISITHRKLSQEIGTAREVVSRILKELEKEGIILIKRGEIRIEEPTHLQTKLSYLQ